jgi:hypothetical protein
VREQARTQARSRGALQHGARSRRELALEQLGTMNRPDLPPAQPNPSGVPFALGTIPAYADSEHTHCQQELPRCACAWPCVGTYVCCCVCGLVLQRRSTCGQFQRAQARSRSRRRCEPVHKGMERCTSRFPCFPARTVARMEKVPRRQAVHLSPSRVAAALEVRRRGLHAHTARARRTGCRATVATRALSPTSSSPRGRKLYMGRRLP